MIKQQETCWIPARNQMGTHPGRFQAKVPNQSYFQSHFKYTWDDKLGMEIKLIMLLYRNPLQWVPCQFSAGLWLLHHWWTVWYFLKYFFTSSCSVKIWNTWPKVWFKTTTLKLSNSPLIHRFFLFQGFVLEKNFAYKQEVWTLLQSLKLIEVLEIRWGQHERILKGASWLLQLE